MRVRVHLLLILHHPIEMSKLRSPSDAVEYLTQGRPDVSKVVLQKALEKISEEMLPEVTMAVKNMIANRPDEAIYPLVMAFKEGISKENLKSIVLAVDTLLQNRHNQSSYETMWAVKKIPLEELDEYVNAVCEIAKVYPLLFVKAREELLNIKAHQRLLFAIEVVKAIEDLESKNKSDLEKAFDKMLKNTLS